MRKMMEVISKLPRKVIFAIALLFVLILVIILMSGRDSKEQVTYRENVVQSGDLVVGITESGSVDVGTVQQVFELDMSALQRAETNNSSDNPMSSMSGTMSGAMSGMGGGNSGGGRTGGSSTGGGNSGGMDMFSQIFSMASGGSGNNTESIGNLTVSEVCVSIGQQVQEGDVLYLLEEESVTELKEELQSNVEKAEADLNAVYADQTLSKQTAQYTYDSSVAYGGFATTEYNNTLQTLQDNIDEAQANLESAQNLLAAYQEQLVTAKADYDAAYEVWKNCEWSRDNTNRWNDTYLYVYYFELAEDAEKSVETLEKKVEQLENNVEQATQNVESCTRNLASAKRNQETGKLTAAQTLQLRQLAYDTAQETYDIAMGYLEDSAKEQEETYAEAKEKWEEFSNHIDGNAVKSNYNGVITEVNLAEGDSIRTNDALITLYDMDEVSMTVSVDEEDMTDIAVGTMANISFTAYPDVIFEAEVSEIGDAETDSYGNVSYQVTVTLKGDVSGLFQGMTGDITFITKETVHVLYISNRAVIREGTRSYVKVRDEKGKIQKKEITTGFSDGVNVEIVEGLSEGDVVLIESKVSES